MVILAIRDRKDRSFFKPLCFTTLYEGLRTLAAAARDKQDNQNMLNMFPSDFEVYHLANFHQRPDADTPVIETFPQPVFVSSVEDLDVPRFASRGEE